MSILWCGGEDIDFPNGAVPAVDTTAGRFRSGYARCCLQLPTATGLFSTLFPGGAVTSAWLSFYVEFAILPSALPLYMLALGNSAGGFNGLYIMYTSGGKAALYKYDSGGTQLAIESGASFGSTGLYKIDFQLTNYGASSTAAVYVNGTQVITYSGSTSITGLSGFNRVQCGTASPSQAVFFSEIIVADEDTRAMSLVTMAPNALGTTDQWTGSYTDCNPITINDANAVSTNVVTQDEQFNVIDLPTGTFTIKAVKAAARAMHTSGSTATQVALGVNSGGTVNAGTLQAVTTSFATYERLMTTNPVTGNPWLQSEMNPLQLNLRSG